MKEENVRNGCGAIILLLFVCSLAFTLGRIFG